MPANKNAFIRYVIICRELHGSTRLHPVTKDELIDRICIEAGYEVSGSTIEKDIHVLKNDSVLCFYAPIKIAAPRRKRGYYLAEKDWMLSDRLKKVWRV